ncbi:MAG: DEAD/DEAH box helicase [Planctomycetes bacterium]|nr:DEAD/DEAH box helicase [Planctomycetota bacterium]
MGPIVDLSGFVRRLRENRADGPGGIDAWHRTEPRVAEFAALPAWLHPALARALASRGILELYRHQRECADFLHAGRHAVIATSTASGKSLAYQLPVLDALLRDGADARALFLYPTKALARDQMADLERLLAAAELTGESAAELPIAVYDGDTPPAVRQVMRDKGVCVLTNPHMLHQGILPNHTKWHGLFSGLRFVVLDELHTLSGIYGSHVANVLRRLRRICRHYGSDPVFCGASATIANAGEHGRRLFERPVEVVDRDGSPAGGKHYLFLNPHLVSAASGMRVPASEAARQLGGELLQSDLQTIFFARSRTQTEVLLKYLRDEARAHHVDQGRIAGYRGGYLPNLRRAIERGLRDGAIRTVVSTNALELGVDIGSLDVCVLVGYPGTVASTFQRAGRVGRRTQESAVILIARSAAMDQFLVQHPEYLFGVRRDAVSIDPDNPIILTNHVRCAAFELPFDRDEGFGEAAGVDEVLEFLAADLGVLIEQGGRYHYADRTYPAEGVSLTAADMDNVTIQDVDSGKILAEIDRPSAITEVHEGAIYGHQGDTWLVERFDYDDRRAFVKLVDADYYTEADVETEVKILHLDERQVFGGDAAVGDSACSDTAYSYVAHRGEVHVSTVAKAFKKIKFYSRENVGIGPIELPPEEFETEACALVLSPALIAGHAGGAGKGRRGAEASCLQGVGELVQGLVPLFVRVDPGDVRVLAEVLHPHFEAPTLILYDRVPNGVGLAERVYRVHRDILAAALELATRCACRFGCPSCVGPSSALGARSKAVAVAILAGMLGHGPTALPHGGAAAGNTSAGRAGGQGW